MAIKRPDTYEHNNPKLPFVLSKDVKGGALKTADLTTLLSDFVGYEEKLEEGVTKAYVVSENADYRLVNAAAVNMLVSWEKVVTGGDAPSGSNKFEDLEDSPYDNELLGIELNRIDEKAQTAADDVTALLTKKNVLHIDFKGNASGIVLFDYKISLLEAIKGSTVDVVSYKINNGSTISNLADLQTAIDATSSNYELTINVTYTGSNAQGTLIFKYL